MRISETYAEFMKIGSSKNDLDLDYLTLFKLTNELVEVATFCPVSELKLFINSLSEDEFYYMPFWLKSLVFKL